MTRNNSQPNECRPTYKGQKHQKVFKMIVQFTKYAQALSTAEGLYNRVRENNK